MSAVLSGRYFTLARALGRSGIALKRCWLTFLLVTLVIGLPEVYVFAWIDEHFDRDSLESLVFASVGISLLDAIGSAWLTAAVLRGLSGRAIGPASRAGWVQVWLVLVPAYAVGNCAWNVGFGQHDYFSFAFGVIAAIMISVATWVYTSVAVVESHGFWTTLRRSLTLAADNGWRIAMLVLLYLAAYIVVVSIAWSLFPFGLRTDFVLDYAGYISVASLLNVMLNQMTTVMSAASYLLLRNDKDGVPVEDVAPVFD